MNQKRITAALLSVVTAVCVFQAMQSAWPVMTVSAAEEYTEGQLTYLLYNDRATVTLCDKTASEIEIPSEMRQDLSRVQPAQVLCILPVS